MLGIVWLKIPCVGVADRETEGDTNAEYGDGDRGIDNGLGARGIPRPGPYGVTGVGTGESIRSPFSSANPTRLRIRVSSRSIPLPLSPPCSRSLSTSLSKSLGMLGNGPTGAGDGGGIS